MLNGIKDLTQFIPKGATVVEIGCYAGESTELFLACKNIKKLICIDPWPEDYYSGKQLLSAEAQFDKVTAKAVASGKLEKRKDYSAVVLSEMIARGEKIEFIYIDGNHSYEFVRQDILLAKQLVKEGGIIAGHDYKFHKSPGVEKAVKELLGFPDVRFADYSWIKFADRIGVADSIG
jgi:predicted O-methyltransferase YrrM